MARIERAVEAGSEQWWAAVVGSSGGQQWWAAVVGSSGWQQWLAAVVGSSGEQQWWPAVVAGSGGQQSASQLALRPFEPSEGSRAAAVTSRAKLDEIDRAALIYVERVPRLQQTCNGMRRARSTPVTDL